LVIVGAVTCFVIAWQSFETRRAVQASKVSADALINSERAWVTVDLDKVPGIGTVSEGSHRDSSGEMSHDTSVRVRCICSNHGKTPAKVIEKRCCLLVVTAADPLPQIPNLDIEVKDAVPHYLSSEWSRQI